VLFSRQCYRRRFIVDVTWHDLSCRLPLRNMVYVELVAHFRPRLQIVVPPDLVGLKCSAAAALIRLGNNWQIPTNAPRGTCGFQLLPEACTAVVTRLSTAGAIWAVAVLSTVTLLPPAGPPTVAKRTAG
jgi:hypothetical protein